MSNFYVYEHWRLDKDECFYVGKGKGSRAYRRSDRNSHWNNIVNKLERIGSGYEIRLVATGLSEADAFTVEKERILFWQDKVDLCNKTIGGDGISGYKHTDATKQIMSTKAAKRPGVKSMFGKKHTEETKKKMSEAHKGVKKTPEHAAKVGLAHKGKKVKHTDETRAKMSLTRKGKPLSEHHKKMIKLSWDMRKLAGEVKV
jgi:hypothetical protein